MDNGEDALRAVRHESPEVVVLDQKMPKVDGIQTLKEIKKIRPEVQVIMLTGHGSIESARETGKHDVFHYLQKPCPLDELIDYIEAARQERVYAMARHEIPAIQRTSLWKWLVGSHNARPGFILLGVLLFSAIAFMPTPDRMMTLLTTAKTGQPGERIAGYSSYLKMKQGESISDYYSQKAELYRASENRTAPLPRYPLGPDQDRRSGPR